MVDSELAAKLSKRLARVEDSAAEEIGQSVPKSAEAPSMVLLYTNGGGANVGTPSAVAKPNGNQTTVPVPPAPPKPSAAAAVPLNVDVKAAESGGEDSDTGVSVDDIIMAALRRKLASPHSPHGLELNNNYDPTPIAGFKPQISFHAPPPPQLSLDLMTADDSGQSQLSTPTSKRPEVAIEHRKQQQPPVVVIPRQLPHAPLPAEGMSELELKLAAQRAKRPSGNQDEEQQQQPPQQSQPLSVKTPPPPAPPKKTSITLESCSSSTTTSGVVSPASSTISSPQRTISQQQQHHPASRPHKDVEMSAAALARLTAEFPEFTRKQIRVFAETFHKFDEDHDSYIDFMELKRMMEKLGEAQTHVALKQIIQKVDDDKDGKLSLREFLLIFRYSATGTLGVACGDVFVRLAESIDVAKEGVVKAAQFFEAKMVEATYGTSANARYEAELRAEQEERQKAEEAKLQRRRDFQDKKAAFV